MAKKLDLRIDLSKVTNQSVDFQGVGEDDDLMIEEYINERKLRDATGEDDLKKVRYLEIVVNTTKCSLGSIGKMLPSLKQIKLNGSSLNTIRDIGTSIINIEVMWISRCTLNEFDGISIYSQLTELYASYNQISDLFPISFLDNLEILDLEGNNISSENQLYNLSELPKLTSLNLSNNPFSLSDRNKYLSTVKKILPSVQYLDDYEISGVQNLPQKPLVSKKKEEEYQRQRKLLENEISFMKNSIRFTRVDENSTLENSPRIICKAPQYLSIEEKEIYIKKQENRPMTARARFRGGGGGGFGGSRSNQKKKEKGKVFSCSSFNHRPMTARPSKEYVNEDNLFSFDLKPKKAKEQGEDPEFLAKKECIKKDFTQFREDIQKREVREIPLSDDDILKMVLFNKFQKRKKEDQNQMKMIGAQRIKRKKLFTIDENEFQPIPPVLNSEPREKSQKRKRKERKSSKKKSKVKKLRNPKKMKAKKKLKRLKMKKKKRAEMRNKENFNILNQTI